MDSFFIFKIRFMVFPIFVDSSGTFNEREGK